MIYDVRWAVVRQQRAGFADLDRDWTETFGGRSWLVDLADVRPIGSLRLYVDLRPKVSDGLGGYPPHGPQEFTRSSRHQILGSARKVIRGWKPASSSTRDLRHVRSCPPGNNVPGWSVDLADASVRATPPAIFAGEQFFGDVFPQPPLYGL